MTVAIMPKGKMTVAIMTQVTSITTSGANIVITGVLETSGSTSAQTLTFVAANYIIRIMDN